jgi:hypothetical protein
MVLIYFDAATKKTTITVFLTDGALRLDLTRRAVAEADAEAIHRVSHALRAARSCPAHCA